MKVRALDLDMSSERAATWDRAFGSGAKKPFKKKDEREMTEHHTHIKVCAYLKENYPDVRFYSTLDGFDLGNQKVFVQSLQWFEAGVPDLFVWARTKRYSFLALELKKFGIKISKSNEHQNRQSGWLQYFRSIGAKADFAIGLSEATRMIDTYLKQRI